MVAALTPRLWGPDDIGDRSLRRAALHWQTQQRPRLSPHSSGTRSLEEVCLQVTDLLPGLRKLRNLLPEHGCLLLSPANFWQNDREHFHADPDIIRTIHQHEPKTLQTSATLKGTVGAGVPRFP